jgi:hypothetical protein
MQTVILLSSVHLKPISALEIQPLLRLYEWNICHTELKSVSLSSEKWLRNLEYTTDCIFQWTSSMNMFLLYCSFWVLMWFPQHILFPKEFCRQNIWEALSFGVMEANNFVMYCGVLWSPRFTILVKLLNNHTLLFNLLFW